MIGQLQAAAGEQCIATVQVSLLSSETQGRSDMQQHRPKGLLNGWPFVGVASVAILAAVLAAIAITPEPGEAAARAVRLTARTSA